MKVVSVNSEMECHTAGEVADLGHHPKMNLEGLVFKIRPQLQTPQLRKWPKRPRKDFSNGELGKFTKSI